MDDGLLVRDFYFEQKFRETYSKLVVLRDIGRFFYVIGS